MATIKEIALNANVSTATVSRILSNDQTLSVTEDTRKRVFEVAAELDYKPPRKKNSKSTNGLNSSEYTIGVILTTSEEDEFNDPYFQQIRLGIEMTCQQFGLKIGTLLRVERDQIFSGLNGLDGLIVVGAIDTEEVVSQYYENKNIVFVDNFPANKKYDLVRSDLKGATIEVIHTLLESGHQTIGYMGGSHSIKSITGEAVTEVDEIRKATFQQVMQEKGLYNPQYVLKDHWNPNGGYQLMKGLIEKGNMPDAMIIGSDPMAIGALRALNEAGIQVPEDLSVISFDDIESAAFLNPPLSTVKIHPDELGKAAVKLLADRLITKRTVPVEMTLGTELILRKSSRNKQSQNESEQINGDLSENF
ncbi:LacI family DNA-binding transcriptional regulator [Domibacillus tundrae]|uniref:LacI family DNA-binding transcriptional regulator n=1 Tax=Domibacillus tundrae TaxID=1587527 RepID=UPI0033928999